MTRILRGKWTVMKRCDIFVEWMADTFIYSFITFHLVDFDCPPEQLPFSYVTPVPGVKRFVGFCVEHPSKIHIYIFMSVSRGEIRLKIIMLPRQL